MGKIIIVCGKICAGKTYYSNSIKNSLNAVILSSGEVTYDIIDNEQGELFNRILPRIKEYLTKKAGEIAKAGATVIYERGLWSKKERDEIKAYYDSIGVDYELHYIKVDDITWEKNIEERNRKVLEGNGGVNFYFDEKLKAKLLSCWEEPTQDEYDVLINVNRE